MSFKWVVGSCSSASMVYLLLSFASAPAGRTEQQTPSRWNGNYNHCNGCLSWLSSVSQKSSSALKSMLDAAVDTTYQTSRR